MPRYFSPAGSALAAILPSLLRVGLVLAAGWGSSWAAAEERVPVNDGLLVTAIQQYWDVPLERKAAPIDFELACTVTYFDPEWRILFVQDERGDAAFVPYGSLAYPFKAGEAILARGRFVPPSLDISFEHAVVEPREGRPLVPVDVTSRVTDHTRLIRRYVSLEGVVDWSRRVDARHFQVALSVGGETVLCWVQMDPATLTPDILDRKVRVEGVYNPRVGPDGKLSLLEIMVSSMSQLTVLGQVDDDPGFQLPVTEIGRLRDHAGNQMVRVVGSVVARESGRHVRIRDGSGQIDLMTGQMRPLSINDLVEAIGYPVESGGTWRLDRAVFRAYARPAPAPEDAAGPIRVAADVLALSAEEAAKGRPVKLLGVVTWSHNSAPFFFIHDSSGGICVMRGESESMVRSPGRYLEVQGRTAMGAFAPLVQATKFERVSESVLPVARPVSVEHAFTGVEEAQWIEMRGYLRGFHREGIWNRLDLATATSDFTAMLPATEDIAAMIGSVVRLQGVCAAEADAQRRLTGIRLWVPGIAYVQVEEPAPVDPFTVPLRSLASLGQFETVQSFNRRVRVTGTVLHQVPGDAVWIEDGGHNLLLSVRDGAVLQPGERVEAVGFLGREAGRIVLREAQCRVVGRAAQPQPQPIDPVLPPLVALDGKLVQIEGVLLESVLIGEAAQLTVQSGTVIFGATLDVSGRALAGIADGSVLRLTGVHEIEFDQSGRPSSFTLQLRDPADVVVIETPSWWTRGRIMAFTGMLAFGALLFLGWITVLRRQVHRQTGQIRAQLERETRLQAELARAGKLESLGLLAGGIAHDFNNLLTVLMGNISLVRLDGNLSGDAARSLDQAAKAAARARDLTQQLLTFAKGGAPLRAAVSLPEIVREVTEFALRGSKVIARFQMPDDLWPANVDKGQIGQVVQNIVINALQVMPDGGVVDVVLSNRVVGTEFSGVLAPGRYLRLEFTDHGPGIAASDLARIFDPYFTTKKHGSGLGLATVHSIVKKHAGHITVDSEPNRTTFQVWLPAAESGAVVRPDSAHPAPRRSEADRGVRVLVMDDEEFIRNLAASILQRNGCQVTAVADGAAALREYESAREAGKPYALVILDLTIPGGMGGRQTMEELLKLDPAVRAIVSSGYSNDLVLANYQAHGFRGMISKPYDVSDFTDTVERVLRGDRA